MTPITDIEKATRKLVILNCSVNGAGGGYSYQKAHRKWYINKPKIWKEISSLFNQQHIEIRNDDYKKILSLKTDLLYLDPPYYQVAQKGNLYTKGLNTLDWNEFYTQLCSVNTQWIMSNRDCLEIRQLFKHFYQLPYNTYNDMNNTRNNNPELLISNYPLKKEKI